MAIGRRWAIGSKLALGALVVMFALYVFYGQFGMGGGHLGTLQTDVLYNVIRSGAALCCLVRAALVRSDRGSWLMIGTGLTLWAGADIYWGFAFPTADDVVYPSPADALYLAFYPFVLAGIWLNARRRVPYRGPSMWLDGLIGVLAVSAIGAAFLYPTLAAGVEGDATTVFVNLAYPLGDILLLSSIVCALALTRWQLDPAWLLLGVGITIQAVADGLYLYMAATTGFEIRFDFLWLVAAIAIAAAATVKRRSTAPVTHGLQLLVMPAVFAGTAVTLQVWDHFHRLNEMVLWLATATLVGVTLRFILTYAENHQLLVRSRDESLTDALTGLGNRRRLLIDLSRAVDLARQGHRHVFVMFDLDGFKAYNDTFGHPAGDALLRRLGVTLAATARPFGGAYRLGGDEFCILAALDDARAESIAAATSAALVEKGEGFSIESSYGQVVLPQEAEDVSFALGLADQRLYAQKRGREGSPERQTRNLLVRVLQERGAGLGRHLAGVTHSATLLGRAAGLTGESLDVLARGAEFHDVGKMAIPDEVLHKPDRLTELEWEMIREHTVIGERILLAAPALVPVAKLVRSSHERWDGNGYPDGLSGEDIPLGARIIAICDAYEAMTEARPYRPQGRLPEEALAELRACAGTQFDSRLVDLFCDVVFPHLRAGLAAGDGAELIATPV